MSLQATLQPQSFDCTDAVLLLAANEDSEGICHVLREVLNYLQIGVALLDEQSHVLYFNREAQRIIELQSRVILHDQRLMLLAANSKDIPRELLRVWREQQRHSQHCNHTELFSGNNSQIVIEIQRLPVNFSPIFPATTVVFFRDANYTHNIQAQRWATMFKLSTKETALAQALIAGKSLKCYAREANVSVATVRSHLRNVLLKTHTRRQVELVSVLSRQAPLH